MKPVTIQSLMSAHVQARTLVPECALVLAVSLFICTLLAGNLFWVVTSSVCGILLLLGTLKLRSWLSERFGLLVQERFGVTAIKVDEWRAGNYEQNTTRAERDRISAFEREYTPGPMAKYRNFIRVFWIACCVVIVASCFVYYQSYRTVSGQHVPYSPLLGGVVAEVVDPPDGGILSPNAGERLAILLQFERCLRRLKARGECFLSTYSSHSIDDNITSVADPTETSTKFLDELRGRLGKWQEVATKLDSLASRFPEEAGVLLETFHERLLISIASNRQASRAVEDFEAAPSLESLKRLKFEIIEFENQIKLMVPSVAALLTKLNELLDDVFGPQKNGNSGDPCVNDGFPLNPGEKQGEPDGKQGEPGGKQGEPGGKQGEPGGKQGEPGGKQGEPGGKPGEPDGKQGEPDGKQGEPGGKQGEPGGKQGEPGGKQGEPGGKPGDQGGKPGDQGAVSPSTSDSVGNYRNGQGPDDLNPDAQNSINGDVRQGIPVDKVPIGGATKPPAVLRPSDTEKNPPGPRNDKPLVNDKRDNTETQGEVEAGNAAETTHGESGAPPIIPPSGF